MVPITIPSFAALGILGFVGSYNSYIWPSLILKSKTNFIVSMGLQSFFYVEGAYGLKWGTIMAACGVVIFPLLFIFIIAERWIIYSISSESAVKE
jgi:multiple sugar transport system permease protein